MRIQPPHFRVRPLFLKSGKRPELLVLGDEDLVGMVIEHYEVFD